MVRPIATEGKYPAPEASSSRFIDGEQRDVRHAVCGNPAQMEPLEGRLLLSAAVATHNFVVYDRSGASQLAQSAGPVGLTPSQIRTAYGANEVLFGSVAGNGSGQTIAIVDAYNAPTISTDLATFDQTFGLPACSLTVVGQTGSSTLPGTDPSGPGDSWAVETSLDVEWAHAMAPDANIVLVEAKSDSVSDLFTALTTAKDYAGVSVVSISWGTTEFSGESSYDSYFTTPSGHTGVTFVVSSGDSGAYNSGSGAKTVDYPAASPNVLAVGGTSLSVDSKGDYISETGWGNGSSSASSGGSGGGISSYETQPSYQKGVVTQSSTYRTVPDVAFDADPNTGVAVIDSYDFGASSPWVQVGGTSLAAPMWAGVIAIADQGVALAGKGTLTSAQTLAKIYALPSADFHDITSGNNGYAAGAGYDLVTGRGSPLVNLVAEGLAGATAPTQPAAPTIASLQLSPSTVTAGASVTLTATNVADSSAAISKVAFYRETAGTTPQPALDQLIGYGTQQGSNWTITAGTSGLSTGSYTLYAIATDASGNSSSAASATLTVQAAAQPTVPTIASLQVSPSTVTVGASVTLTATNVADASASISRVAFYTEANPAAGAQPATDHFIGYGTQQGNNWTITAGTGNTTPGTYTVYAIATDTSGAASNPASATVTIQAAPQPKAPTIASLTASPSVVPSGAMLTLTAVNVVAPSGTAVYVAFYTEANPAQGPHPATDHFIGYGTKVGNNWVIAVGTRGTPPGTYTVYAIATAGNLSSSPVTTTVTIQGSPTQTLSTGAATASVAKATALPASGLAPACAVAPSTAKAPTAAAVAINTEASPLDAMLAVTAGASVAIPSPVAVNTDASWWDAINAAPGLQQLPRALNQK
jgi:hypothetical protein